MNTNNNNQGTSTTSATFEEEKEVQAIHEIVAAAETHQNEPEEFCRLLTEEVSIINVAGRRIFGRDAFYKTMKDAMKTHLGEVITRNEIVKINFLHPDVALVSCYKHFVDKGTLKEEASKASLNFVMVKENRKWMIASAQSTLVKN
jgi:uncharacterized protein (TIGR02246 family)